MKFFVLVILFLNLACFSWAGRIYHSATEEWNDSHDGTYSALGCGIDLVVTLGLIKFNPLYACGYLFGSYAACHHVGLANITVPIYTENISIKKIREVIVLEDAITIIKKEGEKYSYYKIEDKSFFYSRYYESYTPRNVQEVFTSKEKILEDLQRRYSNAVNILLTLEYKNKEGKLINATLENLKTRITYTVLIPNKNNAEQALSNDLIEAKFLKNFFPQRISLTENTKGIHTLTSNIKNNRRFKEVANSFEMFLNYYHTRNQKIKYKKYIYFEKFHNELIKLDQALGENKKEYLPEIYYSYGMYHLFNGETMIARDYFSKFVLLEINYDSNRGYVIELIQKIDEVLKKD